MDAMQLQPCNVLALSLMLVCLAATAGCFTPAEATAPSSRGRSAVKVMAQPDGRLVFEGEARRLPALARLLRREGPGRAVVLSGAPGVSDIQLLAIRQELVQNGVPNIAIARARTATATVTEGPESPAAGDRQQRNAPQTPASRRSR